MQLAAATRERYCVACGKATTAHVHKISDQFTVDTIKRFHLTARGRGTVSIGSIICCRHFLEGHTQRVREPQSWLLQHSILPQSSSGLPRTPKPRPPPTLPPVEAPEPEPRQTVKQQLAAKRAPPNPDPLPPQHFSPKKARSTNSFASTASSRAAQETADLLGVNATDIPNFLRDSLVGAASGNLTSFREAFARLHEHIDKMEDKDRTSVPIKYVELVLKASLIGVEKTLKFTLQSVVDRELLAFYTSFHHKADIERLFIEPLQRWYEENPKHIPRSDYYLEDRVLWCLTLLHRGMLWSELHKILHPLTYPGSEQNLAKVIRTTFQHLSLALEGAIRLPSLEEWRKLNVGAGIEAFPGSLLLFIDGTSLPVRRPVHSWLQRGLWVQYKKHHACRYFILTTADGTIVFISQIESGNVSDTNEYTHSNVRETLDKVYGPQVQNLQESERFVLGGDKGYIRCQPPACFTLILTKSADLELSQGSSQTAGDEISTASPNFVSSTAICRPRAVIERTFGKLKRFAALSSGRVRWKDNYPLEDMIFLAAVIVNDRIAAHKLKQKKTNSVSASSSSSDSLS